MTNFCQELNKLPLVVFFFVIIFIFIYKVQTQYLIIEGKRATIFTRKTNLSHLLHIWKLNLNFSYFFRLICHPLMDQNMYLLSKI